MNIREQFEYEAGKALSLPTNIIELARKGDGYDHAFDSMSIMQPLNGWWHWWKAGAASMQAERDQLAAEAQEPVGFLIRDKYTPNGYFSHTNSTVNISQDDICEHEVSATALYAARRGR